MVLAGRLLKEFWIPAVLAALWTTYSICTVGSSWSLMRTIELFGPSFFLASWATGQFFRVQKQAKIEKNLLGIDGRLENVLKQLEKHAQDIEGYSTGSDSVAYFETWMTGPGILELALWNHSIYPLFDVEAELVDHADPVNITPPLFKTQKFVLDSLYPGKLVTSAYRLDLNGRDHFAATIWIKTRSASFVQVLRFRKSPSGEIFIASKTTNGEKVVECRGAEVFPGFDPANPDAIFA